ncbi:hypothetical protein GOV06_04530 [Candidatus Woesearchaeota archaeon]|nr:hypothetical protein [Candidatus Woesearchaeota archaeon]
MNTKLRLFSVLALMLIGLFAISGIANADSVPVSISSVFISGLPLADGEVRGGIVRGDTVDILVKLDATDDDNNVVVEVTVEGLDHDSEKATDKTSTFTVKTGKTYYKTLTLELPERMDVEEYALRIEVSNRKDDEVVYNAVLEVESDRHKVIIKDVIFSPENQVKAGRALLTSVRVKNMGEDEEEDVKIKVSIPELGISASDYIDELESEDSVTSEELYMRIPECAETGQYAVTVTVEYDDGDEEVSESFLIDVVEGETCGLGAEKTVIAVSTEAQTVKAGKSGAVYPISISNTGSSAKTYTVSSEASEGLDVKISPNVAVLSAGETKVVYVYASANEDASAGEQTFGVTIKSGDETLKELSLKVNVEASSGWDKVKKGLEVALVVLVVLLVVIGLIIGFNRLKGDEDEDAKEETYY